eukprot:TRINITY_DN6246_c0_g1_i3.p1 TRINITY_DN6246_c0_g1~~TRINITY_DN6246_c0_g1_i3.p1  ORF type:complete len:634 (+),score=101.14 TRINITY_DN6246_c0_g1_i3:882-2783(+)
MEGVRSVEDLYLRIKDIPNVSEAVIRTFNLLCPYDEPLPKGIGDEEAVTKFYGDPWFDGVGEEDRMQGKLQLSEQQSEIQALQMALNMSKNQLKEVLDNEAVRTSELQSMQKKLQSYAEKEMQKETVNQKYESLVKQKEKIVNEQEIEIQGLIQQLEEKVQEINELKEQAKYMEEGGVAEDQYKELEDKFSFVSDELAKVRMQLDEQAQKEKCLREKAGQLFLQAMSTQKVSANTNKLEQQVSDTQIENMQDDESIVKMFLALKKNPKISLKQRLIKADINGDKKLNQNEFNSFCKDLGLSPVDSYSLSKVAQLGDGKRQMIGIDEFISIIQERPKMREAWQKQLMKKLLGIIYQQNLTVDRLFDLIDINNDKMVSKNELQDGLEALQIILSKSDLVGIFNIFDKNRDGTISLEEMKQTLQFYEKLPDDDEQQRVDFGDRMKGEQDNDFDEEKQELTKTQKLGLNKNQLEQGWAATDDLVLLNGDLKIQIPWGRGLIGQQQLKQVILRLRLRGTQEPKPKAVLMINKENWGYAVRIPVQWTLEENLSNFLNVQLWSQWKFDKDEFFLGELFIKWKDCLKQPEKWTINMQQQLENVSLGIRNRRKKSQGNQVSRLNGLTLARGNFMAKQLISVR